MGGHAVATLIVVLALWEVYWTYHACWLASQRNEKPWFLFFLVFNLLGIPEIIYVHRNKPAANEEVT